MKKLLLLFALLLVCGCSKTPDPGVILTSPKGRHFVGDQLAAFDVAKDGTVGCSRDSWVGLYYTEGKPFRVSGEVWLGGVSPTGPAEQDFPEGFALFLREWDSLHRYALTPRGLSVKRRKHSGRDEKRIANLATFRAPMWESWIPFMVEAREDLISFQIGDQSGAIPGPIDMDGANKITLGAGTKLKGLRLEVLQH